MRGLIERLLGEGAALAALLNHELLLPAILLGSLAAFVGTLVTVPLIIARLPAEHFLPGRVEPRFWRQLPRWSVPVLLGAKNALGALFLVFGLVMLAIPGQGLVTILIGLSLIDFPGKHRLERWLKRAAVAASTSEVLDPPGGEPAPPRRAKKARSASRH